MVDAQAVLELLGDAARRLDAVDGERVAGGDGGDVGCSRRGRLADAFRGRETHGAVFSDRT